MNLDELNKIPISSIERYLNIGKRKKNAIIDRRYPDAANLRDQQKIIDNYRILDTISDSDYENIVSKLRERKINEIINDTI